MAWLSNTDRCGAAGNADADAENRTVIGASVIVEGTERPSMRSDSWSWIDRAHARHVDLGAAWSDADAPFFVAHSPVRLSRRKSREGNQALSA